jgi:hypothetical protein
LSTLILWALISVSSVPIWFAHHLEENGAAAAEDDDDVVVEDSTSNVTYGNLEAILEASDLLKGSGSRRNASMNTSTTTLPTTLATTTATTTAKSMEYHDEDEEDIDDVLHWCRFSEEDFSK